MQLKTLNRQQGLYSKAKTMMKNNLIALLDQAYPGVNALFDNSPVRENGSHCAAVGGSAALRMRRPPCGEKWVDFATAFWHVDCVRNMSLTAFTERYRKWCKRHGYNFSQSKAIEIHAGVQDLIAMLPRDALTKAMVRQAIDALNAVSKSLEQLKAEMCTLAAQLPEYPVVMAMRGVGDSLGPQLMAEIGDVTRFAHRGSITAFAGVDPGADQSGTHEAKGSRTSNRTPMPVMQIRCFHFFHGLTGFPVCPQCGRTLAREYMPYCGRCGQCLDWKGFYKANILLPQK